MPNPPTPNMNLILPTVGGDPNVWGQELNTAIGTQVDGHTHELGSGVPINPLGLNINSDLSIQGNNLNLIRSIRLANQSVTLSGPGDIGNVYEVAGNLYWNNAAGVPVQITNGTVVNSSAVAATIFPQTSAASNFNIPSSATYIEVLVQTTAGSWTISLPAASSIAVGRYFIIKDVTGNAASHNITISASGADTIDGQASIIFNFNFESAILVSNGTNAWSLVSTDKHIYNSGEVLTFNSGAELLFNSGSEIILDGYQYVNSGAEIEIASGGALVAESGSVVTLDSVSIETEVTVQDINLNGTMTIGATGTLASSTGSAINIARTSVWDSEIGSGYLYVGSTGAIKTINTGTIQLVNSSSLELNPAETINLASPIVPLSIGANWTTDGSQSSFFASGNVYVPCLINTSAGNTKPFLASLPLKNGGTLNSVTLVWNVGYTPSAVPSTRGQMTILQETLAINGSPTVSNLGDILLGSSASSAAYWNSGYLQSNTATCSTVIDTTQYNYFIRVFDCAGSNDGAGNGFFQVISNITVPSMKLGL